MGKRIIISITIVSLLLSKPIYCHAETASDIYKVYGIDKQTDLDKATEELDSATTNYNQLVKDYAFAEFYNEALSLTTSQDIMTELNATQPRLRIIEQSLLSSIDEPIDTIMSYDNEYTKIMDYTNFLLKALDSYSGLENSDVPEGDLTSLENELYMAQEKYGVVSEKSDIGSVTNLIHPVQAVLNISSGYGTRVSLSDSSKTEFHNGIDIKANKGTGVLSMFAGIVIYADFDEEKGETVRINHGDGIITEYQHLEERYVREGDTVKQYQKIGTIGNTGKDTGEPHLHLSIYIDGKTYDPSKLFRKENANAKKDNAN